MIAVRINRVLIIARLHPDRRTLAALIFPLRVSLSTSKVSRSPSPRLSGSMPCNAVMCINISGPPESSLMKPKPRSAFHIFKLPVAIPLYFPFAFSPASPADIDVRAAFSRSVGTDLDSRARLSGDGGGAGRVTRGDGGAVSWHGSARAISLLFPLHLQPICNCSSLIFLKITCSCLARERTAVSVRFIRMPIALELSPLSANLAAYHRRPASMVEKRNARVLSLVHAPRGFKANQIQQISRCRRRSNGLPLGRSGQRSCQSNGRRRSRARSPARRLTTSVRRIPE